MKARITSARSLGQCLHRTCNFRLPFHSAGININNPLGHGKHSRAVLRHHIVIRTNGRCRSLPFRIIKPRSGVHYALFFLSICGSRPVQVTQFFRYIIDTSRRGRPRSPSLDAHDDICIHEMRLSVSLHPSARDINFLIMNYLLIEIFLPIKINVSHNNCPCTD